MNAASEQVSNHAPSRALHIALWVVQALLALVFLGSGGMKLSTPHDVLVTKMRWAADAPAILPALIGGAEVLGALGLLLPAATRVLPVLTPVAAACLALVMALAGGTHLFYGELPVIGVNVVFGGLAAFVAWGRLRRAPIAPR